VINPLQGQLTIKWRLFGFEDIQEYQGMSYSLDTANHVLKVRWQPSHVRSVNDVVLPPIPTGSDSVDGETVVQYSGFGRWDTGVYHVN
jgi:hypothetical protein